MGVMQMAPTDFHGDKLKICFIQKEGKNYAPT